MAENSKIEWTHHTFNPWRGCTKVSAGCANCYAESLSKRNPATLGIWGDNGTRVVAAESYWKQPLKWNREAERACFICGDQAVQCECGNKTRPRVFCASLADVFEDRPELIDPRHRLMQLIESTLNLDWLLLTKRPENIGDMLPVKWFGDGLPSNLWIGTSVENQEQADRRIPELLKIPARVRFLSCEPLLGPVDLSPWMNYESEVDDLGLTCAGFDPDFHWVIVGGESGSNARPMHPDWARSLRDQCQAAGVPFFFKQWGEFLSGSEVDICHPLTGKPPAAEFDGVRFVRVGKKAAGRLLDGREWNEVPGVA